MRELPLFPVFVATLGAVASDIFMAVRTCSATNGHMNNENKK